MPDISLLARAADCYLRADLPQDAARCYRAMGAYRPAAEIWDRLGAPAEAARDYASAGAHEQASWILVHDLGDVPGARGELARAEAAASRASAPAAASPAVARDLAKLRRKITQARCDAEENVAHSEMMEVMAEVMEHLETNAHLLDDFSIEQHAVAVAEAMGRPDLVAQVFAAAVRGGRHLAAERWDEWSRRVLKVPLILPEPAIGSPTAGDAVTSPQAAAWPGQI